jgi:hypothetical protein
LSYLLVLLATFSILLLLLVNVTVTILFSKLPLCADLLCKLLRQSPT